MPSRNLNAPTRLKPELREKLAAVAAFHFQAILNLAPQFLITSSPDDLPKSTDSYKRLDAIITRLRQGNALERLLSHGLRYTKQHQNFLRHSVQDQDGGFILMIADVAKAIDTFNDLLQALSELVTYDSSKQSLFDKVNAYAMAYYDVCLEAQIAVSPLLTFVQLRNSEDKLRPLSAAAPVFRPFSPEEPLKSEPESPEPEFQKDNLEIPEIQGMEFPEDRPGCPPQNQTIRWYKENGWRKFLTGKRVILTTGKWQGYPCWIDRWNSGTARFLFDDNAYHCINDTHHLTWTFS